MYSLKDNALESNKHMKSFMVNTSIDTMISVLKCRLVGWGHLSLERVWISMLKLVYKDQYVTYLWKILAKFSATAYNLFKAYFKP